MPTCRPNRSTGTRARIAMQEETCWGERATSGQNPLGWDYASETLRNDITNIDSALIRSDRMRSPGQQGNHRPGGDVNGELQPHGPWAIVAKHVLGGSVTTTGSAPYTHSLEGSVDLPEGLTVEKRFGFPDGEFVYLQYLGCRANEFAISVPTEGVITARAGLLARQEHEETVLANTLQNPDYPTNNEPFNTFHGSIMLDRAGDGTREAVATITAFDMLVSNSIDGDQFAIDGVPYRADLPEDLRVINGNVSAFFTLPNWDIYTEGFIANKSLSLDLTLARGQHSWQFTIHQFKVRGNATPQVGGRGPLNIDFAWEAHRDDDEGTDIDLVITNADPVLSTAA